MLVLGLLAAACASEGDGAREISEREHRECLAEGFRITSGTYAICRRLKAERRARDADRDRGNRLMTQ